MAKNSSPQPPLSEQNPPQQNRVHLSKTEFTSAKQNPLQQNRIHFSKAESTSAKQNPPPFQPLPHPPLQQKAEVIAFPAPVSVSIDHRASPSLRAEGMNAGVAYRSCLCVF